MSGRFDELRREYPQFVYSGYSVSEHEDGLHLSFDFSIPGLCEFHPQTRLDGKSLDIFNSPVSDYAKRMVFFIGLAEAVSYWKCACPPVFRVECGEMSEDDKAFSKSSGSTDSASFLSKRDKDGYRLFCAYRRAGAEKYSAVRRLCFVGD